MSLNQPSVFSYKFRLYPTQEQQSELSQWFWATRYIYNKTLALSKFQYQKSKKNPELYWQDKPLSWNYGRFSKTLKHIKQKPNSSWIKNTHSQVLQNSLQNLNSAFQRFFKLDNVGFPQFKKKKSTQSLSWSQNVVCYTWKWEQYTSFPWFWHIKTVFHRSLPSFTEYDQTSATLSKDTIGRYFVSIRFIKKSFETHSETGEITEVKRKKWLWRIKKGSTKEAKFSTTETLSAYFWEKLNSFWFDIQSEFTQFQSKQSWLSTSALIWQFVKSLVQNKKLSQQLLKDTSLGIDMGVKDLAVLSDWTTISNPKFLTNKQKKLAKIQRRLSLKLEQTKAKLGLKWKAIPRWTKLQLSSNFKKQSQKLAKVHAQIADTRKDFFYKIAHQILQKFLGVNSQFVNSQQYSPTSSMKVIFIEDINIAWMLKNRKLARIISDTGIRLFLQILKQTAYKYNVLIEEIWRFNPSSKQCSECFTLNQNLKLSDRSWTCSSCWTSHNRDYTASQNIIHFWLQKVLTHYVTSHFVTAKQSTEEHIWAVKKRSISTSPPLLWLSPLCA